MAKNLTLHQLFQIPENAIDKVIGKTFVGIDFGTSTTVVSIASYDVASKQIICESLQLLQLMPDGNPIEAELTPTIIAINSDGRPLVGQGAYSLKGNPEYVFGENIWHSFKMELGENLGQRWYRSKQAVIKSPQDATKFFFKKLKQFIEKACSDRGLSTDISYAVSIPASFESNQRKDLLEALAANEIAMSGKTLIDEPNAAFIGYVNPDMYYKEPLELRGGYNPKVLVFDFGAGTCDISLLEINADYKGYHSRNISISQFSELGGNDIDRYIAYNYLLPRILKLNGMEEDDYTTSQLEMITNQLMGIAEKLKIAICKDFEYILTDKNTLDDVVKNNKVRSLEIPTNIYTDYKDLVQNTFSLSYSEFIDTMKVFFKKGILSSSTIVKRQKRYNSVYATIESAINKAHISKDEIDYVMMIGGSSKNPFVQKSIKNYFKENTKVLIPQNMQSLVSQGAAIHSLLTNGFGSTIVRPITSEPIVVVTAGEQVLPIIPAGTEIPFPPVKIDQFSTGEKEMSAIEIPICVTNEKKMLANLKIADPLGMPLPPKTQIVVTLEMNADKLLTAHATCMGIECVVVSENPFANTYLTDEEKKIMDELRNTYIAADKNGGIPTRQSLRNLRQAYVDADKDFQAAEILEEEIRYYPQSDMYNYLGVLYHNGGNYNKAIYFLKKAIENDNTSPWPYANLGNDYFLIGKYEEAKEALLKALDIRAESTSALITLGQIYSEENNLKEARGCYEQAYNILMRRFHEGNLDRVDYGWLIDVARKLGKYKEAQEVEAAKPKKEHRVGYNKENLASVDTEKKTKWFVSEDDLDESYPAF